MAEDVSFSNSYCAYITNQPYQYSYDEADEDIEGNNHAFNTGWHVLPNVLWRHFVTPKQFAEFHIKYQSYTYVGHKITLFNMIPMHAQLAFGSNQIYTAFNNCIYALGYQDKHFETNMFNWFATTAKDAQPNLAFKEGVLWHKDGSKPRLMFPHYTWKTTAVRYFYEKSVANNGLDGKAVYPPIGSPRGMMWDPMNNPSDLMEFRPGKNAMTFTDSVPDCDKSIWYNLDAIASWYPYTATGPYTGIDRPATFHLTAEMDPDRLTSMHENPSNKVHDYTIPNWWNQPVVHVGWWWKEMQQSIVQVRDARKPDLFFPGTEKELAQYPPQQMFTKLIPLWDDRNNTLPLTAQICVKVELFLKAKPRQSSIYCPTWGPFSYTDLYSHMPRHANYRLAAIRYRTGGMRRTWQNMQRTKAPEPVPGGGGQIAWDQAHAREDPYKVDTSAEPELNPAGGGVAGTYSIAPSYKDNLTVTFSRDLDRVVLHIPEKQKKGLGALFKRKSKTPDPSDDEMQ